MKIQTLQLLGTLSQTLDSENIGKEILILTKTLVLLLLEEAESETPMVLEGLQLALEVEAMEV